jgi:hypothetical protein
MSTTHTLLTSISLALVVGLASGCGDDKGDDTGSNMTDDSGSSGPGATGQNPTTTADSGDQTTTSGSTISMDTGPVCLMEGANGDSCTDMCGCASGKCFVVDALGGVCSDCEGDEDCADMGGFGCNFGNPLTGVPAVCSQTGELGEGCESGDACAAGLFCTTLIEVPGVISAATCSECEMDSDCMGGQVCAPTYDIESIAGHYRCIDPGTAPDLEGCTENSHCESDNCAPAGIMGIPVLEVCSECNEDTDCSGMSTCQLPELVLDDTMTMLSLSPGQCV